VRLEPRGSGYCIEATSPVPVADEMLANKFVNSGTQTGPFLGIPATGTHAQWLGIGIYTVHNGRITEAWFSEDLLHLLLQLGAVTLPHRTAPRPIPGNGTGQHSAHTV
jgi:SnoaL-like polyketide cyclase